MEERIKKLVNIIDNIEFEGFDNIKLGSAAHLLLGKNTNKFGVLNIIKQMFRFAINCEYSMEIKGTGEIVFLYSNANKNRKYVLNKIQKVAQLSENRTILKPSNKVYVYKFCDIIHLIKWRNKLIDSGFNKATSNYLAIHILYAYLNLNAIKRKLSDEKINLIMSVHDTRLIDSVVIQYYNSIGICTCGLQHGEINRFDAEEEYGLSFSKYHCIYSQYTYDIIKNFIKKEQFYFKLGMPQLIGMKERTIHNTLGVFGVFLNYYVFEKENIELIKFANQISVKYNLKYIIKLHPSLDEKKYVQLTNNRCIKRYKDNIDLGELIEKIDFGIFSKSTMFFELICLNIPCLEYKNGNFDNVNLLQVNNIAKFDEYYDGNITNVFFNEMEEIRKIVKPNGDVEENYRVFLKKFEEDKLTNDKI